MKSIRDDINSAIRHMRLKGINPNLIYVNTEVYEALGEPEYYRGIPVLCDDGLRMPFRVD